MRSVLKRGAERVLARAGEARLRRGSLATRALVLAYHNIVPDGEAIAGDRSLHLPQRRFAEQLDLLGAHCEVVPLDEVLTPARQPATKPRVAITFDDAYRGAVWVGVQELAERGMPATLFVAPGFPGGASFWWDLYADERSGSVPADFRRHCLSALRGDDAAVRAAAQERGRTSTAPPEHATAASETELLAVEQNAGITLGSHTWSHRNLQGLDEASVREELGRSLQWLRDRFLRSIPWLAYPYGLYSPTVERIAKEAGYVAALRVDGGWMPPRDVPRFALPRFNVPAGLSASGFLLRISRVLAV